MGRSLTLYDVCVGCRRMQRIEKCGRCSSCLAYWEVNWCNPPAGSSGGPIDDPDCFVPRFEKRPELAFPSCASCASPRVFDLAPGATWREGRCANCGFRTEVAGREAFLLDKDARVMLKSP